MRLRSDGPLNSCDQPKSSLNRKECVTATGLQTWYQLPVQVCMRQVKKRNQRKKKGGGKIFFHCEKGSLRALMSCCQNREKKRMEGLCPVLQSNISDLDSPPPTILQPADLNGGISRVMFAFLLLHLKILQSRIQCYSLAIIDIISRYLWIGLEIESSEPGKPCVPTVSPKAVIHVKG